MNIIQEKLRLAQEISDKTQAELAREFGVTTLALNNWYTGKSYPRQSRIKKLNAFLNSYGIVTHDQSQEKKQLDKKEIIAQLASTHKNLLQKILKRPDLIDEFSLRITYNSNAIEGNTMTKKDTASVIFDQRVLKNKTFNEQLEAKNHDKAFRYLLEYLLEKKHIDENLTKKLHSILMAGILDNAGSYRYHPVRIVGSTVPTANHLKLPELMKRLFSRKIQKNDVITFVSQFHAEFEKIHPFSDGNGRIGRLLLIGVLLSHNIAPAIITKKKKLEYYQVLEHAKKYDEYENIENFICDAIIEAYSVLGE